MKIAISGAAGYVGSALANYLIKQNYDVFLFDNYSTPSNITEIEGVKIHHLDIRDDLELSGYDVLFHLAAVSGIYKCEENKEEAFSNNVKGTFNLLRRFRGKVIFASTSAVYGQCETPEIDETHPTIARSYYGITKLEAEKITTYSDGFVVLRFSNIYGRGLFFKKTVADIFIEKALKEQTIEINGDGRQRRDFVHINDCISAYILAMKSITNGIYNIGGNEALSINDIAQLVVKNYRKISGYTLPVQYVPVESGIQWKDFIYSSQKAKDELGYEPSYSIGDEIRERLNANRKIITK